MKFPMIHAGEWGETHFEVPDIPQRELAVGSPPNQPNPPGQMSDLGAVTTMSVISFTAGTESLAHNAPQLCIVIVMSDEGEFATSDIRARVSKLSKSTFPVLEPHDVTNAAMLSAGLR